MQKMIRLNSCSACPYKLWKKQQRICRYSDNKVIDVAITDIPEWCELENYETEKAIDQATKESSV